MYNLELKTAPITEPVAIGEIKAQLRIENEYTEDDAYLSALIIAAREYCEGYQNRAYITQTWEMYLDDFNEDVIEIPKGKLQTVNSITYKDRDGLITELETNTDYICSNKGILGRICPPYAQKWPEFIPYPLDAIAIDFTCGYGDEASDVPQKIRQAIILLVSHWYENRVPIDQTRNAPKELEFTLSALLWQDRIANV